MTTTYEASVNSVVTVLGTVTSTTGAVSATLYKDGSGSAISVTATRIAGALVSFSFTPTATGRYYIYCEDSLIACVEVVTKTTRSYLQNIEDEALGSWSWNKTTGALTLLRQDGTTLGSFTVVDNLDTSSRERL
jgi:hypothetical protein